MFLAVQGILRGIGHIHHYIAYPEHICPLFQLGVRTPHVPQQPYDPCVGYAVQIARVVIDFVEGRLYPGGGDGQGTDASR